jgi:hypothetical protein
MPTKDFAEVNANDSKSYIGDGVYATFDGYNIWLSTQSGSTIALEPGVFDALLNYRAGLKAKFLESGHIEPTNGMFG